MSARFLQLHFLTPYAANNLNRDDLGRPKSLVYGTAPRLRLSSQCVKRAWRLSPVMETAFAGDRGLRTRAFWTQLAESLMAEGFAEDVVVAHLLPMMEAILKAKAAKDDKKDDKKDDNGARLDQGAADGQDAPVDAAAQAAVADAPKGKGKGKAATAKKLPLVLKSLESDLYFYSKAERTQLEALVRASLAEGKPMKTAQVLPALENLPLSGDIAMFGRMVTQATELGVEGAVQVAHPFTVNRVVEEDDYFIAADDDLAVQGAAHIAANGYGAGLYYGYVNIDVPLLIQNLDGNKEHARQLILALMEAVATVAPGGKQNTFSARSYATYMMAEVGNAQPRSFADAFLTPVNDEQLAEAAIAALEHTKAGVEKAFPSQKTRSAALNRVTQEGSFDDLAALVDELL